MNFDRFELSQQCFWCGITLCRDRNCPRSKTREHIIPRSLGGCGKANIVGACMRCNSTRGSATNWIPFGEQPKDRREVGEYMRAEWVMA